MTIIRPTTINARFSQPVGLGGEKLWLCPTLGGDRLDLSGNGNHGTYYGGMGTVVSKYRGTKAFLFDGSNTQRIECDPQVIGSEPVFSVSCWVYVNQHDASYGEGFVSQFGAGNNSATCKFSLATVAPSSSITPVGWIRPSTSNVNAPSSESFEAQTWHHLCFMADGSKIFTYLDGFLRGTNTYSGTVRTVTNPLVIGTYNQLINQNHYLNGMVDDVRAYSRVLSPTEIKHLASYRGVLGSPRQPYDPLKRTVVRVPAAIPTATKVGSIKKPTTIIKPSYQAGYARNASESENPKLWDGLVGAWMPSMGDCGYDLNDLSGRGNHAELDGRSSPAPLKVIDGSRQIVLDGSSDYFRVNNVKDFSPKELTYCYWVTQPILAGTYAPGGVWRTGRRSWLSQHGSGYPQFFHSNDGSNSSGLTSSVSLINNKLTFVVMRYGEGSKQIWQNGVRTALATGAGVSGDLFDSQTEFCIGDFLFVNSSAPFGRNWQGGISAQMVYNRLLLTSEIKQLYFDSLAPFRKKQRVSVAVPAATPTPAATYHPLRSLAHPLEQ